MAIKALLKQDGRGVITIEGNATVGEALWILQQAGAGALVVSDNGRDIRGLVSGHDLIRAFKSHGVDPLMPMTVAGIMRRDIVICRPDESLRRVMARMTARGLGHVAVVDETGPCGVLSLADILKGRLQWARAEVDALCNGMVLPA